MTSAGKHTAGPWMIGTHSLITSKGALNVRTTTEEGQANARLIAAAPAMLEALTKLVETLDGMDEIPLEHRVYISAYTRARAAIAEAKGDAQ